MNVKLKIVDPELYHFTLHFFGDISDSDIDKIRLALDGLDFTPFQLDLKGTGVIPNKNYRKARVLYVNPRLGSHELLTIQKKIEGRLRNAGFQVNKRSYLPHLTVSRIRGGRDVEKIAMLWSNQDDLISHQFEISEIVLVHSTLTNSGPMYQDLITFS
jgi:2'-5' RNA ligase